MSPTGAEGSSGGVSLPNQIPWQTAKRVRIPQKYDPKTLLTAERYFLKWTIKSTFLGICGIGAINFGGLEHLPTPDAPRAFWHDNLHVVVGLMLVLAAVIGASYSLLVLHARSRRIYARRKIRYDDVGGPTWLTIVLAVALVFLGMDRLWLRFGPMLTRDQNF